MAEEFSRGGSFRGYSGAVSSPPYLEMVDGGGIAKRGYGEGGKDKVGDRTYQKRTHGEAPAQIVNLKDPAHDIDAVLTSPPFEDSEPQYLGQKFRAPHDSTGNLQVGGFESAKEQISSLQAETYLSAMLEVYRELAAVLKPGGVVCLVTKNPIKGGKIRALDADTIRLMEAAGFGLIERKRAMLAQELGEQTLLGGGSVKIRRERKSFFKRLYEKKHPEMRVDHEDVLFFRLKGGIDG